jgi:parallel beta-helix repeat protein
MRFSGLKRRFVLVGVLIAGAFSQYLLDPLRPMRLEDRASSELIVSNGEDAGPGSLREALFSAARANERPRIRLQVNHITIQNPLPPATHALGFVIEGDGKGTVIDATALGHSVALDVQAPNIVLRNLTIDAGAGTAVLIRANDILAQDLTIEHADVGIGIAGARAQLRLINSTLRENRIALQIMAATTGLLQHNHFENNTETGIWAVLPAGNQLEGHGLLQISDNKFTGDRDSIVLANAQVTVEKNEFVGNKHNAVSALAGEATVRSNTIRGAASAGILADGVSRAWISSNDIGQCPGTGIFLRSAANVIVEKNRLYSNAYGIVALFSNGSAPVTLADNLVFSQQVDGLLIIGASPVVRGNRAMRNGSAGIRVLDIVSASKKRTPATPLLNGNILAGNRLNEVFHGDYVL